jgi:hypothetical protein
MGMRMRSRTRRETMEIRTTMAAISTERERALQVARILRAKILRGEAAVTKVPRE